MNAPLIRRAGHLLVGAVLAAHAIAGWAAAADISNIPTLTAKSNAKPNFMFILDDSGSMARSYMPDEMDSTSAYGFRSVQCNGLAFNPALTYKLPVRADGTPLPNAMFTAAWSDGYQQSGATSLTNSYYYDYTATTKQTPLSWRYTASGSVDTSTPFYKECTASSGSAPGGNAYFTRRYVSAVQQQNYANWYAYYRTRSLLMRSAAGLAFKDLGSDVRVGFTTISNTGISNASTTFLDVADFTSSHKASFYQKLYGALPDGTTPLRASLSKVGRYFGKKMPGQSVDPMQYSCQRNLTLLSTDGYWNTFDEGSGYGPFKLDGTADVGQQDGTETRPMLDGATVGKVRTIIRERYRWTVASTRGGSKCSNDNTKYAVTVQRQERTETTTIAANGASTTTTGSWTSIGSSATGPCLTNTQLATYGLSAGATGYSKEQANYAAVGADGGNVISDVTKDISTGGSTNSLADVSEYYYVTDLRTDMVNNVPTIPDSLDNATHQHLTVYTLGLGVNGTLQYQSNYLTSNAGDFARLRKGEIDWPVPTGTVDSSSGGDATHIDDLWHAAVNGRGQYFAANNADQLASALQDIIDKLNPQVGSAAAASASTLRPVPGDDKLFLPSYSNDGGWHGDLRAYKFTIDANGNVSVGNLATQTPLWSALDLIDQRASTSRRILFNGGGTLQAFNYANLQAASLSSGFDNRCSTTTPNLSQCTTLSATAKTKATGDNLVKYLSGDVSLHLGGADADNGVFRSRDHLLGDIVNAAPVYVAASPYRYTENNHAAFVQAQAGRKKMIYTAANDGMLHAFNADTGVEEWAFVPTNVVAQLWRLADANYDDNHRYFVDATPTVTDVYDGTNWRTILVGGLGAGGRSYYALDITAPDSPKLMWEFTDANMGRTFGNPVIGKTTAGQWIVAVTSGYNNTGPGDGVGRLYVLNAITGQLVRQISTFVGNTTTPSNLGKIEAWVDTERDNTLLRVYGGDMLGYLWRFDINDTIGASGFEARALGQATTTGAAPQPITTRPMVVNTRYAGTRVPIVVFGTGRFLGQSDYDDTTLQSIYAVKDSLTDTGLGTLRNNAGMVKRTMSDAFAVDDSGSNSTSIDWSQKNGWFIDLDRTSKERISVDGAVLFSSVAFASTIPDSSACSPGGYSRIYQLSITEGRTIQNTVTTNSVVVGLGRLVDGKNGSTSLIVTNKDSRVTLTRSENMGSGTSTKAKRTSWRELVD
jgi:type IV pilus assembly protein PilY1